MSFTLCLPAMCCCATYTKRARLQYFQVYTGWIGMFSSGVVPGCVKNYN